MVRGRKKGAVRSHHAPGAGIVRRGRDRLGSSHVHSRIPPDLQQQLRHWACSHDISVSLAVEQAVRLLLNAPESESPFDEDGGGA
jgi:hypothetical protein